MTWMTSRAGSRRPASSDVLLLDPYPPEGRSVVAAGCSPRARARRPMVVRAALEASPELVYTAAALDSLTSALLTLPQIRKMVDRLFEVERP